ncbi:spore coat protein CotJB [Clostridium sp. AM58-1XD]|uniref:spore coat protein CotJB n=1 Tax=Clostridium sp. AM58-1XD TaxID=2292307 RepID=UPI0015F3F805|nr:spore coat protein CotJB [Clostridium sp. AM58-1XD]
MKKEHLAIASVPCQEWGPLYPEGRALKVGTIFEDLNKPFFAADGAVGETETTPATAIGGMLKNSPIVSAADRERNELLQKIDETSFVLDDLILYLDTHPEDKEALKLYNEKNKIRMELKKEFAEKFYPLARDCMTVCEKADNSFCWQEGPSPWEGACV